MFFEDYKEHKSAKLDRYLLWDIDTSKRIPWQKLRSLIIERVVERGARDDWYFILNKYGLETVKKEVMVNTWVINQKFFYRLYLIFLKIK